MVCCSAHLSQAAPLLMAPTLASLAFVRVFVVGLAPFAWCCCWSLWLLAVLLVGSVAGMLRWLVGCSVVRLGGWLGLCVIARGSSWLKPRRLKCRRTCNLGCWVLVVAWWFWGVLAGLGAAWLRLPGLLAGSVLGASLGCAGVGRSAGARLVLLVRGRSVAVWLAAVAAGTGVVLGGVAWFGLACGCFGAGRLVLLSAWCVCVLGGA